MSVTARSDKFSCCWYEISCIPLLEYIQETATGKKEEKEYTHQLLRFELCGCTTGQGTYTPSSVEHYLKASRDSPCLSYTAYCKHHNTSIAMVTTFKAHRSMI